MLAVILSLLVVVVAPLTFAYFVLAFFGVAPIPRFVWRVLGYKIQEELPDDQLVELASIIGPPGKTSNASRRLQAWDVRAALEMRGLETEEAYKGDILRSR